MAKFKLYREIKVELALNTYPIIIGENTLTNSSLFTTYLKDKTALIVTNNTIAPYYLKPLYDLLSKMGCQIDSLILPDGEIYKDQISLFKIYDSLITKKHHRDTTLIALGGGVIGDITGFAAATFHRGVSWIQLPTTLLAQVDAAIGGKTAINHSQGKNLIGAFHQPKAVLIDLNTLNTLNERELRAGFAEIIKYGLLIGGEFLTFLSETAPHFPNLSQSNRAHLIAECCAIKAQVVKKDERETKDERALLNLGHTFAHALETYTSYQRWLHGEAVAIGLYCAAFLSHALGLLSKNDLSLIDKLLQDAKLPRRIPNDIKINTLYNLILNDKKIINNKLHFILMKGLGKCYIEKNINGVNLVQVLRHAVEGD